MLIKNKFSILVALIILYLSMTSAHTFDKVPEFNIPNFDKVVHFGMYFGLMLMITIENRKSIQSVKQLFLIGLIPLSYGILIEFMQSAFTVTRNGSFFDAVADYAGIFVWILLCLVIKPLKREILER
jgi:VanZ family protein